MAQLKGFGRSNGCAFADSPGHMPLQRMANVSLEPAAGGPNTAELIAGVDDGIYIVGDKSWSIDMQRYNFQFTGQRFYRIRNGRLAGQLRDVAYQATTTDFWNSMEAVGGPQTYVLGGAFNCGKGQPGQVAPVSHGAPAALFREVRVLNTVEEGSSMSRAIRPATGHRRARARAGQARRRLRRDRRRALHREPALGRQHADHQRGRQLAQPHRDRDRPARRRRRGVGVVSRSGVARRPGRGHRRGSGEGRRRRVRPPRTRRSWCPETVGPDVQDRGKMSSGATRLRSAPRVRGGAGGDPAGGRGRRAQAVRVRRARGDLDVPRHVGRGAAAARPAGRAAGAEREVGGPDPVGVGRGGAPGTSRTWTSRRWTPGSRSGCRGRRGGWSCPPGGTRRCCRRPRSPT